MQNNTRALRTQGAYAHWNGRQAGEAFRVLAVALIKIAMVLFIYFTIIRYIDILIGLIDWTRWIDGWIEYIH